MENPVERSKTYLKAKHEFDVLIKSASFDNMPLVEPFVDEILELADKFGKSSQGVESAQFFAEAIAEAVLRVLLHKPLCPIMGIAEEWVNVTDANGGVTLFQNNRLASIFKDLAGAWYLDAVVFCHQKGKGTARETFTGGGVKLPSGGVVSSRQYIYGFPFKPKTFYIDVVKLGGEWFVKDEKQLAAVWKYYRKPSLIIQN